MKIPGAAFLLLSGILSLALTACSANTQAPANTPAELPNASQTIENITEIELPQANQPALSLEDAASEQLAVTQTANTSAGFSLKKENIREIRLLKGGHIDYTAIFTITNADDQNKLIDTLNTLLAQEPLRSDKVNPTVGGLDDRIEIVGTDGSVISLIPHYALKDGSLAVNLLKKGAGQSSFSATYPLGDDKLQVLLSGLMDNYTGVLPAFALSSDEISSLNIYDNANWAYTPAQPAEIPAILNALEKVKWTGTGTESQAGASKNISFVLYTKDGVRHEYYLYEKGIRLAGSPQEFEDIPANVYYLADAASLQPLSNTLSTYYASRSHGAHWLGYMNPNRVGSVRIQDSIADSTYSTMRCEEIESVTAALKALTVQDGSVQKKVLQRNDPSLENADITIAVDFDSGIVYTIGITGNELLIASTDITYALSYKIADRSQLDAALKTLSAKAAATPESYKSSLNPATGKPVIYLYPEKEQEIRVLVGFKGNLTYTYPAMNDCWKVIAQPDGTLTNLADDSTHHYLFWEGNSKTNWDFSEGFVVKGSDTQAFLVKSLSALGLTPREYNDFLVYWVPEMKGNPYNLITFSTKQYEDLAPLTVSPAPDTILRVHMVYKPLDKPVDIPPQTLTPTPRKGFTLVEWGGSRAGAETSLTK